MLYGTICAKTTTNELFGILIGAVIFCVVCWILTRVLTRQAEESNARQPVRKSLAMVVEKEERLPGEMRSSNPPLILFELRDGTKVRVFSNGSESSLRVGAVGMLSWQGVKMLSFTKVTTDVQPSQPVRRAQYCAGNAQQKQQPKDTTVPMPEVKQTQSQVHGTANSEIVFCTKCGKKQRKSNTVCWACGAEMKK